MIYELEPGDTKQSEMIYGRKFFAMVHGNLLERSFNVIYCKFCKKQILAKHIKCLPKDVARFDKPEHRYMLINSGRFNGSTYCDTVCQYGGIRKRTETKPDKPHVKTKPFAGYPEESSPIENLKEKWFEVELTGITETWNKFLYTLPLRVVKSQRAA